MLDALDPRAEARARRGRRLDRRGRLRDAEADLEAHAAHAAPPHDQRRAARVRRRPRAPRSSRSATTAHAPWPAASPCRVIERSGRSLDTDRIASTRREETRAGAIDAEATIAAADIDRHIISSRADPRARRNVAESTQSSSRRGASSPRRNPLSKTRRLETRRLDARDRVQPDREAAEERSPRSRP